MKPTRSASFGRVLILSMLFLLGKLDENLWGAELKLSVSANEADRQNVVLANDGSVTPGLYVARRSTVRV